MPLLAQAAAIALAVTTWLVYRLQRANALANRRNLIYWLGLGAVMAGLLAFLVDPGSLVGLPLSAMLLLFWAAPGIALAISRPHRLSALLEYSLNRGDLEAAEKLLPRASEAVTEASPVDADWYRVQLGRLEGRLRLEQGRAAEAIAPLELSYHLARDLGVPAHVAESGQLLLACYRSTRQFDAADRLSRQLNPDSPATHASDSGASVPVEPAGTTSARIL